MIEKHGLQDVLSTCGKSCWSFLLFKGTDACSQWELKTLFMQEAFARGVLTLGTHNMSYAHGDEDIRNLLNANDAAFAILKDVVENVSLKKYLHCDPLVPLFKVR